MSVNTIFVARLSDLFNIPDFFSLEQAKALETEVRFILVQDVNVIIKDFYFPSMIGLLALGARLKIVDGYNIGVGNKIIYSIRLLMERVGIKLEETSISYSHKSSKLERENAIIRIKEVMSDVVVDLGETTIKEYMKETCPAIVAEGGELEYKWMQYKRGRKHSNENDSTDNPIIET